MRSGKPRTEPAPDPRAAPAASFPPQVGARCRVLVLGSVPSPRSLALRQSYGHAQNLFWPFMGELFAAGPDLPYAQRIARLHARGVGIWDVLERCRRHGALDSRIVRTSEVANDIGGLLAVHAEVAAIALNGGKALEVFGRRIVAQIDPARMARLQILALPSTSPANASMPRALKLERWRALLDWADPPPH
ncbi:MAG: DNA-deoxyinosine glycosylase [Dokdonella sp.]|uniref:DNA-deoxyinosine glycosylase n=1 Tax=Dokdonella sp. TaxID=2291710 RepID=UPI0025BED709|nr:DNA-deoxyinosine glycosylase [Dokdonella sp.]MBX3702070.1 DNA-deoxyinosine glycosylase [Dokdonella sp.]MCW5578220.1 DNA-deoxyinosine glycosylase [Dokdonella sp.]